MKITSLQKISINHEQLPFLPYQKENEIQYNNHECIY